MKNNISIINEAERNVDLAPFTTFGLPGVASHFIHISTPEDLVIAARKAILEKRKITLIAGGSNIVVASKKIGGITILYKEDKKRTSERSLICSGEEIIAYASVPLWRVVNFTIDNGLSGLESLSGIPGTLGGAVFGNAGAYGHSISECVESVLIFDGKKTKSLSFNECKFSYRNSIFKKKNWLILSVTLRMQKGKKVDLKSYSEKLIASRNEKYSNIKCPGSFFQNVLVSNVSKRSLAKVDQTKIIDGKIPAGYLLEEVGANGMCSGGLRVADYHGNLIINDGTGTIKDLKKLIDNLKKRVKEKFGIELEEEVRYLS